MNWRYDAERILGWMLNNKMIVFLGLLSFCLFVSTLSMAGQKRRLAREVAELKTTTTTTTLSPGTATEEANSTTDEPVTATEVANTTTNEPTTSVPVTEDTTTVPPGNGTEDRNNTIPEEGPSGPSYKEYDRMNDEANYQTNLEVPIEGNLNENVEDNITDNKDNEIVTDKDDQSAREAKENIDSRLLKILKYVA